MSQDPQDFPKQSYIQGTEQRKRNRGRQRIRKMGGQHHRVDRKNGEWQSEEDGGHWEMAWAGCQIQWWPYGLPTTGYWVTQRQCIKVWTF